MNCASIFGQSWFLFLSGFVMIIFIRWWLRRRDDRRYLDYNGGKISLSDLSRILRIREKRLKHKLDKRWGVGKIIDYYIPPIQDKATKKKLVDSIDGAIRDYGRNNRT